MSKENDRDVVGFRPLESSQSRKLDLCLWSMVGSLASMSMSLSFLLRLSRRLIHSTGKYDLFKSKCIRLGLLTSYRPFVTLHRLLHQEKYDKSVKESTEKPNRTDEIPQTKNIVHNLEKVFSKEDKAEKLMSDSKLTKSGDIVADRRPQKEIGKTSKNKDFIFKTDISDHDLEVKVTKIMDKINKNYIVTCTVIKYLSESTGEALCEKIKNSITDRNVKCRVSPLTKGKKKMIFVVQGPSVKE